MDEQLKQKWEKGKNNTLRFYRAKLSWKAKAFNTTLRYLPEYFAPMIDDKVEVNIADVGAGMFCTTGSLWRTAKVNIFPSDALSDEFNQILKEAGITPLIPVVKEDMENLSYTDEFFDIVHCANALDHTQNPLRAIQEMYRVTRPGGYIYLCHFENVGEREGYQGLHMWNLTVGDDNDGIIWNQKEKIKLSDHFHGFTTVIKKELAYGTDNMVISILKKK